MNVNKPQLRIGFTPLLTTIQQFKDSVEIEFNHWIQHCQFLGSWKSVRKNSFPESEVNEILKLWESKKLNCFDSVLLNKSKKEIVYSKIVEPSVDEILQTLDKLLSLDKEKASIFASWIYTYGLSKLDLAKTNTKLELELNKRFNTIKIAPRLNHCCIGLCSACGRKGVVYTCTNL